MGLQGRSDEYIFQEKIDAMQIRPSMKMAELIQHDFELLAVIQRLKIPFGFKEKSIETVCNEEDIDIDFFLNLVHWFHNRESIPGETLMHHPVKGIIRYLRSTHSCYVYHQIPRIESEIILMEKNEPPHVGKMQLLLKFFREYIAEFTTHINLEEQKVFPYILQLDENLKLDKPTPEFKKLSQQYSIRYYLEEHSDIEEKLSDLRNILLKYMPPPSDNCAFTNLLIEIFKMGKDLEDHTLLEEKVLLPQVLKLEDEFHRKFPQQ